MDDFAWIIVLNLIFWSTRIFKVAKEKDGISSYLNFSKKFIRDLFFSGIATVNMILFLSGKINESIREGVFFVLLVLYIWPQLTSKNKKTLFWALKFIGIGMAIVIGIIFLFMLVVIVTGA